ncbi:unnamed protein product [Gongylonema pulchrum]|uniref:BAF250_C domain-containing protein n=1 Tax=Gongylonema pulchrum TaxID=637853 RepID=A0A183ENE4_9BILA|nr:unnamed protein product [Gongylonema pulchrum]
MGGCICKRKRESSRRACDRRMPSNSDSDPQTGGDGTALQRANGDESRSPRRRVVTRSARTASPQQTSVDACASGDTELDMRELVRQTMKMIRFLVSNEQDAPAPLAKLNSVAEEEGGWIMETVAQLLTRHMRLDQSHSRGSDLSPSQHRNMCIVLGCLAEKLAGPSSAEICCDATLNYLIDNLVSLLLNIFFFWLILLVKSFEYV